MVSKRGGMSREAVSDHGVLTARFARELVPRRTVRVDVQVKLGTVGHSEPRQAVRWTVPVHDSGVSISKGE